MQLHRWRGYAISLFAFALPALLSAAPGKFKFYAADIGTGQAQYVEIPRDTPGERPWRILYDTGKGGRDAAIGSFLSSERIGLRPASGDFEGDVIDFMIMSHPHEDHYKGAQVVFDMFDVRNVIESKQVHSIRYLKTFKSPALQEILRAKAAGKDAHYYIVGLPYPNGFDRPYRGEPYDEYAICERYLPEFLKDRIDTRYMQGKVTWPFGPAQVAQVVEWPVRHLMGENQKAIDKYLPTEFHDATLEVEVLPLGTRFELSPRSRGGFTILHADTVAGLNHEVHSNSVYKEAWPYYSEMDLNDLSVSIQLTYGKSTVLVPGDTEGRPKKPSKMVSLAEVFGSGEGQDGYTQEQLDRYLRTDKPAGERIPLLPSFARYKVGSSDLLRLGYYAHTTFDHLTPEAFTAEVNGEPREVPAVDYRRPEDIPRDAVSWDRRSPKQRELLHPAWRERLLQFHHSLEVNGQKLSGLRTRFKYWLRGNNPRLLWDEELEGFRPDWQAEVWTIVNLVQLTERIYYTDPDLAHILAGFIMRSDLFLEYMVPPEKELWAQRGERHMIHVADQIKAESGQEVLQSDVLVLGHHGSFTSTSLGFMLRVNPNVGIISADDKSYSGSTLPDFSALFWNLNTHHPDSRALLHSIFYHADMLALQRGEPVDGYAYRNRFSQSAARIFRTRRRWPVPLWRTDFNDDLQDDNTLLDSIEVTSDGSEPIWDWARSRKGERRQLIPEGTGLDERGKYQYWFTPLAFDPRSHGAIRPHDPSGEITTFATGKRVEVIQEWLDDDDEVEPEDWTLDDLE